MVLKQNPAAGTRANKGTTVTITVGVLGQPDDADDADDDHAHDDHAHDDDASGGRPGGMSQAVNVTPSDRRQTLTVAVLAGGRSSEHEVSLSSGAAVRDALERRRA